MSLLYPAAAVEEESDTSSAKAVEQPPRFPLGTPLLTDFGTGVLVDYRPKTDTYIIRLWGPRGNPGSSLAYLTKDKLRADLKAAVGFVVVTPYGDGIMLGVDLDSKTYRIELAYGIGYFHADVINCKAAKLSPMVEVIAGYVFHSAKKQLREGALAPGLRDLTKEVSNLEEDTLGKREFTEHMEAIRKCATSQQDEILKHLGAMRKLAEEDPDLDRISKNLNVLLEKGNVLKEKVKDTRTAMAWKEESDKFYQGIRRHGTAEDLDRVQESTQLLYEKLTSDENSKTTIKCKEVLNKVAKKLSGTMVSNVTANAAIGQRGAASGGVGDRDGDYASYTPLTTRGKRSNQSGTYGTGLIGVSGMLKMSRNASPQDVLHLMMGHSSDLTSNGVVLRGMEFLVIAMLETTVPSSDWYATQQHHRSITATAAAAITSSPTSTPTPISTSTTPPSTTTTTAATTTPAISSSKSKSSTTTPNAFDVYSALDIVEALRSGEMVTRVTLSLLRKAAGEAGERIEAVTNTPNGPGRKKALATTSDGDNTNIPSVSATAVLLKRYSEGQLNLEDLVDSTLTWLDSDKGEETAREFVQVGGKGLLSISNHMGRRQTKVLADFFADPTLEQRIRDGIEALDADELVDQAQAAYLSKEARMGMLEKLKDRTVEFLMTTLPEIKVPPIAGVSGTIRYTVENLDMSGFRMKAEDVMLLHPDAQKKKVLEESNGVDIVGRPLTSSGGTGDSIAGGNTGTLSANGQNGQGSQRNQNTPPRSRRGVFRKGGTSSNSSSPLKRGGVTTTTTPPESPARRGLLIVSSGKAKEGDGSKRTGIGRRGRHRRDGSASSSPSPSPSSSPANSISPDRPGRLAARKVDGREDSLTLSQNSNGGSGGVSLSTNHHQNYNDDDEDRDGVVRATSTSTSTSTAPSTSNSATTVVSAVSTAMGGPMIHDDAVACSIDGEAFGVLVENLQAQFNNLQWQYTQMGFPYSSGTGTADANVINGSVKLVFALKQGVLDEIDGKLVPLIVLASREVMIEKLDLQVSNTRLAWVINLLASLFSSAIKGYVCKSLIETIDEHASELLGTVNTLCMASGGGQLLLAGVGLELSELPVASADEIAMARGDVAAAAAAAAANGGRKEGEEGNDDNDDDVIRKDFTVCFTEVGPLGLQLDFMYADDDDDDGVGVGGGGGDGVCGGSDRLFRRNRAFVWGVVPDTQAARVTGEEGELMKTAELLKVEGREAVHLEHAELIKMLQRRPVNVTFRWYLNSPFLACEDG